MNLRLPRQMRIFGCCLAIGCVASMAGCGTQGPKYPSTRLEGSVTVNEQPLAEGGIQFLAGSQAGAPTVGGTIKDGHYAVDGVPLGDVRVILKSMRNTHPFPPGYAPTMDEIMKQTFVNMIPEQHRGGILIKVTAGQSAVQDFAL